MAAEGRSYTCAICRGEFDKTVPDELAERECLALFGVDPLRCPEAVLLVCDDCWREVLHLPPDETSPE